MLMRPHLAGILALGDPVLYLRYASDRAYSREMRKAAHSRESSLRLADGHQWKAFQRAERGKTGDARQPS